jgi:hypothetical protein
MIDSSRRSTRPEKERNALCRYLAGELSMVAKRIAEGWGEMEEVVASFSSM